jgi:exodeoxyribonuclease VII large subunit
LKEKLEAEGLFDPDKKRSIPSRPKKIGIVSSPTGAALQDMLNTIRRRYPLAEVYFSPAAVQGEEAPAEIIRAFSRLNIFVHPDVILVARGGGSLEDLWAFNDENVVRTVAESAAPVISGVGHETDFTLTDFAADLRAPTPTAAAELATPNREALLAEMADLSASLEQTVLDRINDQRWQLRHLTQQLEAANPQNQIRSGRQRVDDLYRRCDQAVLHYLQLKRTNLSGISSRIQAVNPFAVINRGYALVTRTGDGKIVSERSSVTPGDELDVRVKDGHFGVQVTSN